MTKENLTPEKIKSKQRLYAAGQRAANELLKTLSPSSMEAQMVRRVEQLFAREKTGLSLR